MQSHMDAHSTEIIPGLFLGNQQSAHNKKELTLRTHITDIFNVAVEVDNKFEHCREGCACEGGGFDCNGRDKSCQHLPHLFHYHSMKIEDEKGENILALFPKVCAILDEVLDASGSSSSTSSEPAPLSAPPPRQVLVHCIQGISRSASMIIAYLMTRNSWSLRKAYDFVKEKRPIIKPIRYFIEQLQQYEKSLAQLGYQLDGYDGATSSLDVDQVHPPNQLKIGGYDQQNQLLLWWKRNTSTWPRTLFLLTGVLATSTLLGFAGFWTAKRR